MTNNLAENALDISLLDGATVAEYLRTNPDFFADNGELLAGIEVLGADGGTTSLIERQVSVLRDENRNLKKRLAEFVDAAEYNDSIAARLNGLLIELIPYADLDAFVSHLEEAMQHNFDVDVVSIKLLDKQHSKLEALELNNRGEELFKDLIEGRGAMVGRLGSERDKLMFGATEQDIHSAAVVALGDQPFGLLALGSFDENRFTTVSGNELLSRLGLALGALLKKLL